MSGGKGKTTKEKVGPRYRVTTPGPTQAKERSLSRRDFVLFFSVTLLAVGVRYYKLYQPSSVVFDEVHFGGFARKYIIGRFFMDVHPPLAKMLYAVVGYLAGYDGEFEFKNIGLDYIGPGVPYVAMRMLPATLGILTIMLSYATLRASGCRPLIAAFGSGLVTIDNALTTQSRYILLDSPLLFFIAITAYGFKKFENEVPFTKDWFRYLLLTGLGLGATVSSKWVGLFTIGWVGLLTLYQLWWLLGDLSVTPKNFAKQFMARAVFLIGVPVTFYLLMFALHFICVVNDGDGASFMSPEFQSTLQHTKLGQKVPADIAFGSEITLRHLNTQGGYLHSHEHMYETGSKQQQITLYPHKDENNIWVIENITAPEPGNEFESNPPVFIEDGAVIRLRHKQSSRRLHSHDHRPPISEQDHHNEVSAYGYEGFEGDANDNFRVEILEKYSEKGVASSRLRTVQTKFRLVHTITGCTLFSHSVKLPKWAYEQQEVTCIKGGTLPNTIWFAEENYHPQLGEDAEKVTYRTPSFWSKFFELNKVMWRVNAGLTETHTWESRPQSWPLLKRGINFWVKDHRQVYLVGNGVVWWTMTALIVAYVIFKGIWVLRWQRGYNDFAEDANFSKFDSGFGSYLLGWALHYFPSYLMARQLFLHHYLGSLYFGILAVAQFWEFLVSKFLRNKAVSTLFTVLFFVASGAWFVWYSPLIYGSPWTKELCEKSKFLDMDFDCNSFFETYEEYKTYVPEDARPPAEEQKPTDEEEVVTVTETEYMEAPEGEEQQGDQEPKPADDGLTSETDSDEEQNLISEKPSEPLTTDNISGNPVNKEHKVEYRDADGNILEADEVDRLIQEGVIEVETKHETVNKFRGDDGIETKQTVQN
jgi:dolichyl-phosphate-mannose-protein mannosyltransferase